MAERNPPIVLTVVAQPNIDQEASGLARQALPGLAACNASVKLDERLILASTMSIGFGHQPIGPRGCLF